MVKAKYVIITAALAAGIVAFLLIWESEEARVKKRFKALARGVEKVDTETKLISAAKAKKIRAMVTDILTLHAPAYSYTKEMPGKDLPTLILTGRAQYTELSLEFYDMMIEFPEEGTADVSLTGNLKGRLTTGEYVEDIHELKCILEKYEDDWLFNTIEVVEVLEK